MATDETATVNSIQDTCNLDLASPACSALIE